MKKVICVAVSACLLSRGAHAKEPDDRRWGIGVEITALSQPRGHLGLLADAGKAITPQLVARYELREHLAVDAGFGLPHPSLGLGGWGSFELFAPLVANTDHTIAVSFFQQAGLQLGYAGPDYYVRRGGDFVGYQYATGGPLAFALRFPVGMSLRWAGGYLESYVAAVPIVALMPSAGAFYDVSLGTRIRF